MPKEEQRKTYTVEFTDYGNADINLLAQLEATMNAFKDERQRQAALHWVIDKFLK